MKRLTLFLFFSLVVLFPTLAQELINVSGVIVDKATQEPLIGATVLVKGTTTGTSTGIEGDFSLQAPVGSILVAS